MDEDSHEHDQIPVPDPTVRTEERLRREISSLDKSLAKDIDCINEVMVEKFNGLTKEFLFVDKRFGDLEARTAEQKADTKAAVDAALQAAKEAVGQQTEASERSIAKSEAATTKQIDAVTALLSTSNAATGATIDDLKSRMDRMESAKLGGSEVKTDQRAVLASMIGVVLFIITVVGFAIALAVKP
jgi:cobalamin biosynthesis Mg chelatase CobN